MIGVLHVCMNKKSYWSIILLAWIVFFGVAAIFSLDYSRPRETIIFGATFSQKYARYSLGLNWQEAYNALLNDMGFKELRLMTYWDDGEPERGSFNFSDTDWMLGEAYKHNVDINLVVGMRQPRWPECHIPGWARQLSKEERDKALLTYVKKTVERYKNNPGLVRWQVENEPLLEFFGECEPMDKTLLKKEIQLVQSLDPAHPVFTTASGELDNWNDMTEFSDMVGVSLYRIISKRIIGTVYYPLPPAFYAWRAAFSPKQTTLFISELQAEPWTVPSIQNVPLETQLKHMNAKKLEDHVNFAVATGFDRIWLWGVEWWYWLKVNKQHPEVWDVAKTLFPKE